MDFQIVEMADSDWDAVRAIYLEGIATGYATFETTAPEWESWNASHLLHSRLVVRRQEDVIGWAALSPVSGRCVYGGVAEVSIYVAETGRGAGVGNALLQALIASSGNNGIWTLTAGVFPENQASRKLHLKNGFREIGYRERIGRLAGKWHDNILLERRSEMVGIE